MNDCLFCKIIAGDIPSNKVYEDELCYAFYDIAPQAPTHFLVVPKAHIQSVSAVTEENAPVVGHIFAVIARLADELGFAGPGYRVVSNCGADAGQTVPHFHMHIIPRRYNDGLGESGEWPCFPGAKYEIEEIHKQVTMIK